MSIDLHTHSTYSDGCLSPAGLVEQASLTGIGVLALTDHDTVAGVAEAQEHGAQLGVEIIPGVELSCSDGSQEVHILGYKLDCNNEPLRQRLEELRCLRAQRAAKMVSRLAAAGIHLEPDYLPERSRGSAIGRPHIAAALVAQGYAQSVVDAFARYLSAGRPGYVPRQRLSVQEAIVLIRAADGIAVWAHPGKDFAPAVLLRYQSYGLRGIEVWHPDHSPEQMLWFADRTARANLLVTGGSDFHGQAESGRKLGDHVTPAWALAELLNA